MNGAEWTALTALVVAAIGAVGAIVLQALQMYFTYKRSMTIEGKVDENTRITTTNSEAIVENSREAMENSKSAAAHAADTREVAEGISRKLNGGIDDAITEAIRPIREKLDAHAQLDDKNMRDINDKIAALNQYVHTRNHDMLTALQTLSNQVGAVIAKIESSSKTAK